VTPGFFLERKILLRTPDVQPFAHTDIKQAPWYVVKADNKKLARLNCITHLLSMVEYGDLTPSPPVLPPRPKAGDYVRPPMEDQNFVPDYW